MALLLEIATSHSLPFFAVMPFFGFSKIIFRGSLAALLY